MRNGHAVVCGASFAGLLAARVLADFYESVTVVERDELPDGVFQRRGVSQGHHLHMMLSAGTRFLIELFPDVLDELETAGAVVLERPDDPADFHMSVNGGVFCRTGRFTRSDDMVLLFASRPLLEATIRQRVRSIPNVTFMDGHDVLEPVIDTAGHVTGARAVERTTGQERVLTSDLVVDATGRSARTPAFLEAHGYRRPAERRYSVQLSYSSQFFRVLPGTLPEKVVLDFPTLDRPVGAGLMANENSTVIVTMIGLAGHRTATDLPELLDSAEKFLPPHVAAALRAGEAIGEVSVQRYPASTWRRYHKLKRFPQGYLVMGDAICSFNPVFGQGMTSAAFQARALQKCLATGGDRLSHRFFRASARKLSPIWWGNRFFDFTVIPSDDWRLHLQKLVGLGMDRVYGAATTDVVVAETIYRTIQLLDRIITALLRPSVLRRVIGSRPKATTGGLTGVGPGI
ncbi:FAD-dependent oxidoreductase [Mycobacterium sp. 2YAF39]|uniref:FAD-dependent oxidoreductase n=1 Tax=Mycobacterium sp. 2YAF39 TaxID=3233033 RepID=UPI003F976A5B